MSRRALAVTVCVGLAILFSAPGPMAQEAWERIALLGLDTRVLAVDSNSDLLYAGTTLGVWRSADWGETWEQSLDSPALAHAVVTDLISAGSADGTLFAVTEDGFVFRCTNARVPMGSGGFTFQKIKNQSQEKAKGTSLAVDPRYDGSGTYDTLFLGTLGDGLFFTEFAANTDPDSIPATWTEDSSKPLTKIYDLAPGLAAGGTLVVYVGGTGNIDGPCFRRNSGGSYSNISVGLGIGGNTEVVTCLLSVPATPTDTVLAGTLTHGMYKTTNATGSGGFSALCDGVCTGLGCSGTVPRVNAMARSTGSTPIFLEGRDDGPRLSATDGTSCADLPFTGAIQAGAFQRNYNGSTKCYLFYGTPSGLYRRVLGSCTTATPKRGPEIVDGYSVALAGDGAGKFIGSLSGGLFKSVAPAYQPGNMVRYNNFPNKKTPQIVAVRLPKDYNETYAPSGNGCGSHDEMMVFVAANFPDAPADNGVYRSWDWGNSWEKLTSAGWPTGPVWMYDLAISPLFDISTGKITLFAGTSRGLYRWDGDTVGWVQKYATYPVYAVGLPPNYDFGSSTAAVFISTDNGTLNQVFKSNDSGNTWTPTSYSSAGTPRGRVTGFAFPKVYTYGSSNVYMSATTSPSTQTGVNGGVYRYYWVSGTTFAWQDKTPTTITGSRYAWDIAAEPDFQNGSGKNDLYLATDAGLLRSTDAASAWSIFDARPAFSVVYDTADLTGASAMVGFQGRKGYTPDDFGAAIQDGEGQPFRDFWGYHFLPNDVWASVAHERNPDILFSSSPSMGVFVSEDKGLSFRPWNEGIPDDGPCVIRTALGINMLADRRGSGLDVVWVGTDGDGIKGRYIYYNATLGQVDLDTANGVDANGWLHNTWFTGGAQVTGRWERIEVTPSGACSYPVWATSPTLGMAALQGDLAVCSYYQWKPQNSGLSSLVAKGVRQGYQSLQSGIGLVGESVPYHQWNYYQIQVPAGTQDLQVAMDDLDDGDALDPDLYLRHGALPTLTTFDYRPYINGDETVCVRPAATLFSEGFTTVLSENFASGIPGTWAVVNDGTGGGAAATWVAGNNTTPCNPISPDLASPFVAPWAIVDSNCAGNGATQDEQLITPTLNLSGYSAAFLTFTNQFYRYPYLTEEVADVDVSTDGGTNWTNILRMTGADDPSPLGVNTKRLDLTPYAAGKSSVKVRFHYTGAWDYWWAVDNVEVTGLPSGWNIRHEGSVTPPAGTWTTANPCGRTLASPIVAPFLIADASCATAGSTFYEVLLTPPVDCSAYSKVTVSVDYALNADPLVSGVEGRFFVSPDGGYNLTQYANFPANTTPSTRTVDISSTAAGKSAVVLRFYFRVPTGAGSGGWWALDNIRINGEGPKPGTWYVGIYGYSGTNSPYNLTATRNVGCVATPPGIKQGDGKREDRAEADTEEGTHQPEAPSTSSTWGTVNGSGVYKGSGSASAIEAVTWVLRNGTTSPLTNLNANTVVQLSDLTVIAGCDGDVFYSPAPDEGATTWVNATSHLGNPGSNDFRDLLVASNGDVLIAANGTGTGTAAGGVWLSGDKGGHWMRLSSGFDGDSQELTDLVADAGTPPSYYASTGATGEYTRTITADPYPTVSSVNPATGPATGGTSVTITGTGFLGTCPTGTAADCPAPNDKPTVLFGEVEVTPATWTATSITCTTLAGSAGTAKVTVRNPDTRRSSTGPTFSYTCAAPSPAGTVTATDISAYDFTNVLVSWTAPGNWGDAASGTRSYHFFRDGYNITTLAASTLSKSENLTPKVTPHTYFVRQNNGCGQYVDTASASAGDDAEAGAYSDSSRDLKWTSKTQLDWGNVTNATAYRVYRGNQSTLANLDDAGGASVCLAYEGATSASGSILSSSPSSGQFYWYLVTAMASTAEGTLGTTRGGTPRKVSSSGACATP